MFENISYNRDMNEWIEGSGVYKVLVSDLPEDALFVRDPKAYATDGVPPLLHICEKDLDTASIKPTWMILTDVVRWDHYHGYYFCTGCKEQWDSDNEAGLKAIWSDGLGTGDEAQA
jgi:hypothetical protein